MANMANISSMVLLLFFHSLLLLKCKASLAPALYVFGDSLSDSGNNNFLQTYTKVNYKPYGIDFPSEAVATETLSDGKTIVGFIADSLGLPFVPSYLRLPPVDKLDIATGYGAATGRFTNGKTCVDIIAEYLGLPFVPPYMNLVTSRKNSITTGVNYASGAAGILPETGSATGDLFTMDRQINYFRSTVEYYLPRIIKSRIARYNYLAKSIFWISIGNNDYINNYLQPRSYISSHIYTPKQFADLLLSRLRLQLIRLYKLGARKFVVFNIGRLGCVPGVINTTYPRPTTICAEDINNMVLLYNTKLPFMITSLETSLPGSTFVRGDIYSMNLTSAENGFTTPEILIPCCEVRDKITGLCRPNSVPCPDRTKFIFWDAFHTTEVVNTAQASDCFSGSSSCVPINVQQLALK